MILRTYVVFSPRRPLLFLLTSKWLIYKVESYDEVQNLKSCTFSLRSSSPLNKEARKAWLGTTTSNVSLSLWAGSAFLIALIKFLTIQRHHTSLPVVPPLYESYTSHGKKPHSRSFEPILSSKCRSEFKRS